MSGSSNNAHGGKKTNQQEYMITSQEEIVKSISGWVKKEHWYADTRMDNGYVDPKFIVPASKSNGGKKTKGKEGGKSMDAVRDGGITKNGSGSKGGSSSKGK